MAFEGAGLGGRLRHARATVRGARPQRPPHAATTSPSLQRHGQADHSFVIAPRPLPTPRWRPGGHWTDISRRTAARWTGFLQAPPQRAMRRRPCQPWCALPRLLGEHQYDEAYDEDIAILLKKAEELRAATRGADPGARRKSDARSGGCGCGEPHATDVHACGQAGQGDAKVGSRARNETYGRKHFAVGRHANLDPSRMPWEPTSSVGGWGDVSAANAACPLSNISLSVLLRAHAPSDVIRRAVAAEKPRPTSAPCDIMCLFIVFCLHRGRGSATRSWLRFREARFMHTCYQEQYRYMCGSADDPYSLKQWFSRASSVQAQIINRHDAGRIDTVLGGRWRAESEKIGTPSKGSSA